MVNLETYKIFYKVAELKNITKASEELHISQPAVTKQIKNLERELKTPLFVRTRNGVSLNEAGDKIFLNVKQALILLEEAENEVSEFGNMQSGTIKIGISATLAKKYLLNYIIDFHKVFPNIVIDIYTDPTKKLMAMLKNGEIDFIIGKFSMKSEEGIEYVKLGSTRYIFVGNKDYFNILNGDINAKDLLNYPLLLQKSPSNSRMTVDKYFSELNLKVNPIMNIGSANLLCDFLIKGMGIGYVTKLYVQEEIKSGKLFELKVIPQTKNIDYGLMILKNNILPKHSERFISFLKEQNKENEEILFFCL